MTQDQGNPLAVIDQGKIDAPAFPRSQEWWAHWVPGYITAEVRSDGTVALDVTGEAHPSQGPRPAALVRRNQEMSFLRWFRSLPQIEAGVVEDASEACQCWRQPARLHNGHCCFTTASICHRTPQAEQAAS